MLLFDFIAISQSNHNYKCQTRGKAPFFYGENYPFLVNAMWINHLHLRFPAPFVAFLMFIEDSVALAQMVAETPELDLPVFVAFLKRP
jgi:hypothetical protein